MSIIGVTADDVYDPDQVDRLFEETVARLDGLDVLVNNAGVGPQPVQKTCHRASGIAQWL